MAEFGYEAENMIPAPAAVAAVRSIYETEDGVLLCYGTAANTVLEDTSTIYAPGCIYIKSLTAGTSIVYINVGTKASPNFDYLSTT